MLQLNVLALHASKLTVIIVVFQDNVLGMTLGS